MDNQKASKNSFQATTFKAEENSRTFQGLTQKFKDFEGKMEFKDVLRPSPKIQGLFKTVQTLPMPLELIEMHTSYTSPKTNIERGAFELLKITMSIALSPILQVQSI